MVNLHGRDSESRIIQNCCIGDNTHIGEFSVIIDTAIGDGCQIWRFTNLYGTSIGDETVVGSFVEMQPKTTIGARCRIQSHAFICSLVTCEDDVFIGHGAKFINDRHPPSGDESKWEPSLVKHDASIGTNATVLPVEIGEHAVIGAGAVVTNDIPPYAVVAGNPAEIIGYNDGAR